MSKSCWMSSKQCRPWSDATCGIWSGSTLFALPFLAKYKVLAVNKIYHSCLLWESWTCPTYEPQHEKWEPNEYKNQRGHPHDKTLHPLLSEMHSVKILIRLHECAGRSESLLDTLIRRFVFCIIAHMYAHWIFIMVKDCHLTLVLLIGFISAIWTTFFWVVSVAQLVKTLDAAVLGAVAALIRACMAWVRPQAKALRNFSEDYFSVMDGKRRESLP